MTDVTSTELEDNFEDDFEDVVEESNYDESLDVPTASVDDLDLDDLIDWSAFEDLAVEGINLKVEAPPVKAAKVRKVISAQPAWEELFDGLKTHPGIFIRAALFSSALNGPDYRKKASARARSMRARLAKTQPSQLWIVETTEDMDNETTKIFISYSGPASQELIVQREAKYNAAKARAIHAANSRLSVAE